MSNSEILYTPRIKGAKALGPTKIKIIDKCGGYNMGPHDYEAKLPNGEIMDSISNYGNPMGLETLKKCIKYWYIQKLK